jgi:DNA-binding CsgD family transcriptional regulator
VTRPVARKLSHWCRHRIGRPKLGFEIRQKIAQRAAKGETAYAIAKALGVDRHTVAKYAV